MLYFACEIRSKLGTNVKTYVVGIKIREDELTSLKESMQTQSPSFSPIDLKPAHSFLPMLLA